MPYCRKCGTLVENGANFCQKCGTPIWIESTDLPTKRSAPLKKDPMILIGVTMISILVVASVAIAFTAIPLSEWSFNRSFEDKTPNMKTLILNLESNAGQVKIKPLKTENNIGIYVKINGTRGIMGELETPITVSFDNKTINDALIINSKVTTKNQFSVRANIVIEVLVNSKLNLNLNLTTGAGSISLATDNSATFQSLNLQAQAGSVEVTMQNATIAGNASLTTNAGSAYLGISQIDTVENNTITIQSNAGSVTLDVTQNKVMQGTLKIKAQTNLGSVNVGVEVNDDVATKLSTSTNLGTINIEKGKNFSGNQTTFQSKNYPAESNIEIDCSTNLGSINIKADYQTQSTPGTIRN